VGPPLIVVAGKSVGPAVLMAIVGDDTTGSLNVAVIVSGESACRTGRFREYVSATVGASVSIVNVTLGPTSRFPVLSVARE
jgi:hypothetical protein